MNFGHVFITLFSFFVVSLLFPSSAQGNYEAQKVSVLQIEHTKAYELLNSKISGCLAKKKLNAPRVTDSWLLTQTTNVQKLVLFELSTNADHLCSKTEEDAYVRTLFELAVANRTKALEEYIALKRYSQLDKESMSVLDGIEFEEISRLKGLDKFQTPFDPLKTFTQLDQAPK